MNRDADTKARILKDITHGRLYAYVRALEIFDKSKEAMIKELITNPTEGGFYQVILMLAEAIAHEEMAVAYNSVTDVVIDEMFKIFKKSTTASNKTAEQFKADLRHDIRGNLKIEYMMKEAGFADGIREAIRSGV